MMTSRASTRSTATHANLVGSRSMSASPTRSVTIRPTFMASLGANSGPLCTRFISSAAPYRAISALGTPAAYSAPMIAPADTPTMRSNFMPASSKARTAPICANPLGAAARQAQPYSDVRAFSAEQLHVRGSSSSDGRNSLSRASVGSLGETIMATAADHGHLHERAGHRHGAAASAARRPYASNPSAPNSTSRKSVSA